MLGRVLAVLWIAGLLVPAGAASAETLTEALVRAYANNPRLLAERARLRAIDENVPQAASNYRPDVTVIGEAGVSRVESNVQTSTNRFQHRDPSSIQLSVEQPLYRGGRTVAAVREAEFAVKSGRAQLSSVEQQLLLDTATAYVNVVRDQAVVELTANNEQVLRRHLEATSDRFRVGEITRTDVNQAEARLATARAQRVQAEGNLDASRAAYRDLVGEAPGRLEQPPIPADVPDSVDEAVRQALNANPDVLAAEYTERAQGEQVEQAKGELLPRLSLEGTAARALQGSSETSMSESYEAMLVLTVPLYQQGGIYSQLRAARQVLAQQRNLTDDARREAMRAASSAWASLQAAEAQIAAFQSAIDASQVALEGVEREAQVGSRTVLDVLDAEQELLDSRVNLVGAQRDLIVAVYQLKSTYGRMTAVALDLPVDPYSPESHYQQVRDKWFGGRSIGDAEVRDQK